MKYCYLTNSLWVLIFLVFFGTPLIIADTKDDDKVSHNTSSQPLFADTDKQTNNTNMNINDEKFTQNSSKPSFDKGEYTTVIEHSEPGGLSLTSPVSILLILVIAASFIVVLLLILIIRKRRALQKENETTLPEYYEIPIMSFNDARNLLVSNKKISPGTLAPTTSSASQYDDHYSYAYGIRPGDEVRS